MLASFLRDKFAVALPYTDYLRTGTDDQRRRWEKIYAAAQVAASQAEVLASCTRHMKVLVVSGIWCGDCVEQCPLLQRLAEANPSRIDLRFVDRDVHRDLSEQVRLNGGDRVPVALFLAEDHELCGIYGDRTLNRYRGLAVRLLGPACPTGLVSPEAGELAATLQDWLNEFERIQLMLRLSARLRRMHGD